MSKRFSLFILLLQVTVLACYGQNKSTFRPDSLYAVNLYQSSQRWMQALRNPKANFTELTIPLKRAGNLFLIEAEVDGVTGDFIFDTGAPYLVLNITYFREDAEMVEGRSSLGVTGVGSNLYQKRISKLKINELEYGQLMPDLISLAHLENKTGVKILGLLGLNLFTAFEIEFNADQSTLTIRRVDKKGNSLTAPNRKNKPYFTSKFDVRSDILFLPVTVNGVKLDFCFDSGAESNVLHSQATDKVIEWFAPIRVINLLGSGNSKKEAVLGSLKAYQVAEKTFQEQNFLLTDLFYLTEAYNTYFEGILGYDFIQSGILVINFKTYTLNMYPNVEEKKLD